MLIKVILKDSVFSAALFSVILLFKSILDFSRAGPALQEQIENHYVVFAVFSLAKLTLLVFFFSFFMAFIGRSVYEAISVFPKSRIYGFLFSFLSIFVLSFLAFSNSLIGRPGLLVANWLYDVNNLVEAWFWIDKTGLSIAWLAVALFFGLAVLALSLRWWKAGDRLSVSIFLFAVLLGVAYLLNPLAWESDEVVISEPDSTRPMNILMIGSDTMRADRLGIMGYERDLTPNIDKLAREGAWLENMYVPIGRTAPSMTSLLTGTWPRHNRVSSNFIPDEVFDLSVKALPEVLASRGYETVAVGDWAASDLGKIRFGFERLVTAPDQWNIKYLISQGPKDLRLFLSLFTQNEWVRLFAPEIYYLASRPLTTEVGRQARDFLSEFSERGTPFFMTTFIATTHPPFSVEYPYYMHFSGEDYRGRSKFSMTDVFTPEAIAKAQAKGAEAYDVQQIVDLYDAAVLRFDDEVGRIVDHLEKLGLKDNTIVIVFSDHGTDLFEKGTWGQGNTVLGKDPSNHIPFVILDPRQRVKGGISATARSVDIAPTLLDLVGVDPGLLDADGSSLLPLFEGKEHRPRAAYLATGAWLARVKGMAEDHASVPPLMELLEIRDYDTGTISLSEKGVELIEKARDRALRWGQWKLVRLPLKTGEARYALYDLERDDDENVADQYPELTACLADVLDAWAEKALAVTWLSCTEP